MEEESDVAIWIDSKDDKRSQNSSQRDIVHFPVPLRTDGCVDRVFHGYMIDGIDEKMLRSDEKMRKSRGTTSLLDF